MLSQRIRILIARDLSRTITPEEKAELDAWIDASPGHRRFMDLYISRERALAAMKFVAAADSDRIRALIDQKEKEYVPPQKRKVWPYVWSAAAILLVIVAGVWCFNLFNRKKVVESPMEMAARLSERPLESQRPVLITGESHAIDLADISLNDSVRKDGVSVTRTGNRSISIAAVDRAGEQELGMPVVMVPYGQSWKMSSPGRGQVEIAPGAYMALLYDKGQWVEANLKGEAYFDVKRDVGSPFAVAMIGTEMKAAVLGTAFNVYSDDSISRVLLVSGGVKVSNGAANRVLRPGEEARAYHVEEAGIEVSDNVDMNIYLDWRDSAFEFNNVNIRQFMRQVTRWYGLKATVFDRRIDTVTKGLLGGGHIPKEKYTLSKLLDQLKKENHLLFEVKGKTIYVSPDPLTSLAAERVMPAVRIYY